MKIKRFFLKNCFKIGAIAALFTSTYPECVENLILLCPAVKTPIPTITFQSVLNGDANILVPTNGKVDFLLFFFFQAEFLSHIIIGIYSYD